MDSYSYCKLNIINKMHFRLYICAISKKKRNIIVINKLKLTKAFIKLNYKTPVILII